MPFSIEDLPEKLRPTVERLGETISFSDNITKGANGHVLIGHQKLLDRMVVVKFYYWGGGKHIEPALLANLESQHVLKVDHAEAINDDDAFFTTRYCAGGDLDDELAERSFGPLEAIQAIVEIASGVSYLHGQQYVHRDLKPSNLFVSHEGHRVIGDFGSVVPIGPHGYAQSGSKHSIIYRPPEDFQNGGRYYRQGDVYQLGMVFYQLLGGHLPYDVTVWLTKTQLKQAGTLTDFDRQIFEQQAVQDRIERGKVLRLESLPAYVPDKLSRVIRRACHLDFNDRYPTVADFIAALNNLRRKVPDWRVSGGVPHLLNGRRTFKIERQGASVWIEKLGAGQWRVDRMSTPATLAEAVKMVETMAGF